MPQAHLWMYRRMVWILSWWKQASIICCKGDTGIYPNWGFSSVCGNTVDVKWPVGTDWEGSRSREPLSLWISSGNNEGNTIEYIREATLLSEGLGTRKTTWAPLLYSGIHSDVLRSCHWEAQPKASNVLKNVSVWEKTLSEWVTLVFTRNHTSS